MSGRLSSWRKRTRISVAAAAAVALTTAGCSSATKAGGTGVKGAEGASPAGSIPATPPTSIPDVRAQLLTLADLPAGWAVDTAPAAKSDTPACFQNARSFEQANKAKATVRFRADPGGLPALEEEIVFLPGLAAQAMSEFHRVMSSCGRVSFANGGHTFTGTITSLPFRHFGQQTQAYQLDLSTVVNGVGVSLGLDFITIRFADDEIAALVYSGLGAPNTGRAEGYAAEAAARIQRA